MEVLILFNLSLGIAISCSCQELTDGMIAKGDKVELSRHKRSKVQPLDGVNRSTYDNIKMHLKFNNVSPINKEANIQSKPITNLKAKSLDLLGCVSNKAKIIKPPNFLCMANVPFKLLNVVKPKTSLPNHKIYKAPFFLENEGVNKNTQGTNFNTTNDSSYKTILSEKPKHKNETHIPNSGKSVEQKSSTVPIQVLKINNTVQKDLLTHEVTKLVKATENEEDVLKSVLGKLPDLIKSLLNNKKETDITMNKNENKGNEEIPNKLTSNTTNSHTNLNMNHNVLKLLLKPIHQFQDNVTNLKPTGLSVANKTVKENIGSIGIKQRNHTEDVEQNEHPISSVAAYQYQIPKPAEASILGFNTHVDTNPTFTQIYKSPYQNFYSPESSYFNNYGLYQYPYISDFSYNQPPYEYPSTENIIANPYTYSNTNPFEDDKNIPWKIWSDIGFVARRAENDYSASDVEINTMADGMMADLPLITNEYEFDNNYGNEYIQGPNNYHMQRPENYLYPSMWYYTPTYPAM